MHEEHEGWRGLVVAGSFARRLSATLRVPAVGGEPRSGFGLAKRACHTESTLASQKAWFSMQKYSKTLIINKEGILTYSLSRSFQWAELGSSIKLA